jgi:hypothetical protein
MIGLAPPRTSGLRLSSEQLTFCAGMLGTNDLVGVGPRATLDELGATVAARSLAARGLIRPADEPSVVLEASLARCLRPLVPGQPSVAAWVRHPSAGCWSVVRTEPDKATAISEHRAEQAWLLGSVDPSEALTATLTALDRGIAAPGPADALWEVGIVRTLPGGRQVGRMFHWSGAADGRLALRSQEGRRQLRRTIEPAILRRDVEDALAGLAIDPPAAA